MSISCQARILLFPNKTKLPEPNEKEKHRISQIPHAENPPLKVRRR